MVRQPLPQPLPRIIELKCDNLIQFNHLNMHNVINSLKSKLQLTLAFEHDVAVIEVHEAIIEGGWAPLFANNDDDI